MHPRGERGIDAASSCAASSGRPTSAPPARRRAPTGPARRSCGRACGAPSWSGTASTARAWPSVSSPRSTIASTSSDSSSRRSLFEIAGFERPTRSDDLAERELELVHQHRVAARLLDRREVLARDVLDQAEQQRVAVVGLADHRRHGRRCPPRARRASGARRRSARSRPRRAGGRRPAGSTPCVRIESARPAVASWSKRRRGWRGFAWICSTGRCASSGRPRRRSGPRSRGRGRARGSSCVRQAPSPPSSRPRRRGSGGRSAVTGRPWLGASATRTERGTTVAKTSVAEVPAHLAPRRRRRASSGRRSS